MAVNKIGSFAPGDENLNNLMTWTNLNAFGRDRVSLTNWTNSTKPEISAGSIIEAGGSIYEITTDTAISGTPSDGNVYIKIIPSGDTATFQFTNTVPAWDSAKFGYYDTATDNKVLLLKMVKSGTSYTQKQVHDYEGRLIYMNSVEYKEQSGVVGASGESINFVFSRDIKGIANFHCYISANNSGEAKCVISGNTATVNITPSYSGDNYTINITAFI